MPQPGMTRHHLNRSVAAAHLRLTSRLFDPSAPLDSQTSDSQCVLDYGPVPPQSPVKTITRNSPQLEVNIEPSTPKLPQSPISSGTPTPWHPLKRKHESVDEDSHWLYNGTLSSPSLASVASDVEPSATLRIRQLEKNTTALANCPQLSKFAQADAANLPHHQLSLPGKRQVQFWFSSALGPVPRTEQELWNLDKCGLVQTDSDPVHNRLIF
ncbi:hypothetical protein JB92DRAFT_2832084 [Gautieria morchelliformis]|nr:hypothetical protein JB92DRAFT_2832084 [Gautieria morchelliformis]